MPVLFTTDGSPGHRRLAQWQDIDLLITDSAPPAVLATALELVNVQVMIAP